MGTSIFNGKKIPLLYLYFEKDQIQGQKYMNMEN